MTEPTIPKQLSDSLEAKLPSEDFANRVVQAMSLQSSQTEAIPNELLADPLPTVARPLVRRPLFWAAAAAMGGLLVAVSLWFAASTARPRMDVIACGNSFAEVDTARREVAARSALAARAERERTARERSEALERERAVITSPKNDRASKIRKSKRPRTSEPSVPTGPTGKLRLATTPWGHVYLGQKRIGTTPGTLTLPAGRHALRIENPDHGCSKKLTVVIKMNETITKRLSLPCESRTVRVAASQPNTTTQPKKDKPEGSVGTLTLLSVPWADVYLDGKKIGMTPLIKSELPVGHHTLLLKNDDAKCAREVNVTIREGKRSTKRVSICD